MFAATAEQEWREHDGEEQSGEGQACVAKDTHVVPVFIGGLGILDQNLVIHSAVARHEPVEGLDELGLPGEELANRFSFLSYAVDALKPA